ncbi:MAG: HEPN domain-containing protein [Candidatus Kapabacteria bacterium]|jgi:HEPN domain-containing protein|nr:HEPN domain-containing protein [Candidatus Kapabacteria bacterium]
MLTKEEHIKFWIEQAGDDWSAVDTLFQGKKYLQSLFFAHLVVEKICKALWIKFNIDNVPPRSHNLIYLLSQTPIDIPQNLSEFMLNLNRFQLEGRYPDYMTKMHNICNEVFTNSILKSTNELRLWLLEKLQ